MDPFNVGGKDKYLLSSRREYFILFLFHIVQHNVSVVILPIRAIDSKRGGAVCLLGLYSCFFSVILLLFLCRCANYFQK